MAFVIKISYLYFIPDITSARDSKTNSHAQMIAFVLMANPMDRFLHTMAFND